MEDGGITKGLKEGIFKMKGKGSRTFEIAKLRFKKGGLEKRLSRMHARLGERVDYLVDLGRDRVEEDEVVKGFIQEVKEIREEIGKVEKEIEKIKEGENG